MTEAPPFRATSPLRSDEPSLTTENIGGRREVRFPDHRREPFLFVEGRDDDQVSSFRQRFPPHPYPPPLRGEGWVTKVSPPHPLPCRGEEAFGVIFYLILEAISLAFIHNFLQSLKHSGQKFTSFLWISLLFLSMTGRPRIH